METDVLNDNNYIVLDNLALPAEINNSLFFNPERVASAGWNIHCIDNRMSLPQISALIENIDPTTIYGCFEINHRPAVIRLSSDVITIGSFFFEMSGGNVCMFDEKKNFAAIVITGDICVVASDPCRLSRVFGVSRMDDRSWGAILNGTDDKIRARLSSYRNLNSPLR